MTSEPGPAVDPGAVPGSAVAAGSAVATDSAGTPWAGRTLPAAADFGSDTGEPDPELAAALAEHATRPSAQSDGRLVRAASAARWIVPVVALLAEAQTIPGPHADRTRAAAHMHGSRAVGHADRTRAVGHTDGSRRVAHTVEKSTEMATVIVGLPDGRRALPVFTSVAALAAWDRTARPVPVSGERAAQAALAEGCQSLVVDLGGPAVAELRPSMVRALARGVPWQPAHEDPVVHEAVARAAGDEPDVLALRCEEGAPSGCGVLAVVLVLRAGLDAGMVAALAGRVGERLAGDGEFRARVDEVTFRVEGVRR